MQKMIDTVTAQMTSITGNINAMDAKVERLQQAAQALQQLLAEAGELKNRELRKEWIEGSYWDGSEARKMDQNYKQSIGALYSRYQQQIEQYISDINTQIGNLSGQISSLESDHLVLGKKRRALQEDMKGGVMP
ncbi:DUF5082 domain-containing protein [Listeria booriae]|uniref:YwqH-like family protein n=1 Tax=Listeria booriae TaxID=1552123 RepID=UPI001626FB99|nr:DUF5082 family protein [Listeria booriae]MBC1230407.1 DUF5082 domain-containing protein [Listeria booriae]MBC1273802.1 DUF5082 domain-containing protein [Listeria booriae]